MMALLIFAMFFTTIVLLRGSTFVRILISTLIVFVLSGALLFIFGKNFIAAVLLIAYAGAILVFITVSYLLKSERTRADIANNPSTARYLAQAFEQSAITYLIAMIVFLFIILLHEALAWSQGVVNGLTVEYRALVSELEQFYGILTYTEPVKTYESEDEMFDDIYFNLHNTVWDYDDDYDYEFKFDNFISFVESEVKKKNIKIKMPNIEVCDIATLENRNQLSPAISDERTSFILVGLYLFLIIINCLFIFTILSDLNEIKRQDTIDQVLSKWKEPYEDEEEEDL
jgi:NADH:ubiquinone oxidoreductase subunit 6 (subunit J)